LFELSKKDLIKTLKAKCGSTADPCPLHLELNIGYYMLYNEDLKNAEQKINDLKLQIILLKNNLLYHYGNKTKIMSDFNRIKDELTSEIDLYEFTLSQCNQFLNLEEKEKLHTTLLHDISEAIELFQTKCKEYHLNPSHVLLKESIDIYIEQILPLIEEKNKNNFHLIQTKYNIHNLEMIIETPEIVHWVEGMPIKKKEKKEKKEKPEKEKKARTVKVITEEQLVKPKRTLKKKIGTIILEGEEGKGLEEIDLEEEKEEEKEEEEIEEITDLDNIIEERRSIQINEDKNEEIYDGIITYPSGYFGEVNDDSDDDEDNEPLKFGDFITIDNLAEEIKT
jgi:hypothetical protein